MYCTECGKQLNADVRFCTGCGAPAPAGEKLPSTAQVSEQAAPPAARPAPTPAPAPAPAGRGSSALVGVLIALSVLSVVGVGAYVVWTRMAGGTPAPGAESVPADSAAAEDATAPDEKEPQEDETPSPSPTNLSPEDSYAHIDRAYRNAGNLAAEIGVANDDGTYGGTGFAYEVFNPAIGSSDRDTRVGLLASCEELLGRVEAARGEAAEAAVDDSYAAQLEEVLVLYDHLNDRVIAMRDAAAAAVDDPREEAWRPLLTPRSTEARTAFETAYPSAEPSAP